MQQVVFFPVFSLGLFSFTMPVKRVEQTNTYLDSLDGHWLHPFDCKCVHDDQSLRPSRTCQQFAKRKLELINAHSWHKNMGSADLLQLALLWTVSSTCCRADGCWEIIQDTEDHLDWLKYTFDARHCLGLCRSIVGFRIRYYGSGRSCDQAGSWSYDYCLSSAFAGRWCHRHYPHCIIPGFGTICSWCLLRSYRILFLGGQWTGQSCLSHDTSTHSLCRPWALFATFVFRWCLSIRALVWHLTTSSLAPHSDIEEVCRFGLGWFGWLSLRYATLLCQIVSDCHKFPTLSQVLCWSHFADIIPDMLTCFPCDVEAKSQRFSYWQPLPFCSLPARGDFLGD